MSPASVGTGRWSGADVGVVRPVLEEAGCALDVIFRENEYSLRASVRHTMVN